MVLNSHGIAVDNRAGLSGMTDSHPGWRWIPAVGSRSVDCWVPAWRDLLLEAPTERLFLAPEWVLPWFSTFGSEPRGLFAMRCSRPRAALLVTLDQPFTGGPRVLRPPGLGMSDYLDLVLPAGRDEAEQAVAALLDWLLTVPGWDVLDLPNVPAESPTIELLEGRARRSGLPTSRLETHQRPFVRLDATWERYLASRPQKLRYNLRARRRQLSALGAVRFNHYTTPAEVASQLPRLVELHARRWRGQRTSTTFSSSPLARRFYAEACGRMAASGWVDLSTLELDGGLLAAALCFVRDEKLYYYMPAYDPAYARYAPSTSLLAHLIEQAYQRGVREVDFMLGDEPYKEQWASGSRRTERLLLGAPGPRGELALAGFQAYLAARERARRSPLVRRVRRHGLRALREALHSDS